MVEAETVDRPRVIRILADLAPVTGCEQADTVRTREAGGNVTAIGRPGEPVDDLRQTTDPPDEPPRRGFKHIEAVCLLPGEPGPPPGHDVLRVGRQGDCLELTFRTGADLRAQHTDRLAARQRPQPQRLVVRHGGQHFPGGIARGRPDRRGMHAGLEAQHRLRARLLLRRRRSCC